MTLQHDENFPSPDVMSIPMDQIVYGPGIHSSSHEMMNDLYKSVSQRGILVAIYVRQVGDKYHIIDGVARYLIASSLRHKFIPGRIIKDGSGTITPLGRLIDIGMTPEELAIKHRESLRKDVHWIDPKKL